MRVREIRSFVRRQGRISTGQRNALDSLWPIYGLTASEKPIDLNTVFGRDSPKILEIGFGMGHALIRFAQQYPQYDFIGIEVHRPGVGLVLEQIEQAKLTNIRLFCEDAVKIMNNCLEDGTLERILIFFPDPWQKKRHHKRRLIQTSFVELLARKMKTGGILEIATDWSDYAQHIQSVFEKVTCFEPLLAADDFLRIETKYEQRGKRLGHEIWDFRFNLKF